MCYLPTLQQCISCVNAAAFQIYTPLQFLGFTSTNKARCLSEHDAGVPQVLTVTQVLPGSMKSDPDLPVMLSNMSSQQREGSPPPHFHISNAVFLYDIFSSCILFCNDLKARESTHNIGLELGQKYCSRQFLGTGFNPFLCPTAVLFMCLSEITHVVDKFLYKSSTIFICKETGVFFQ